MHKIKKIIVVMLILVVFAPQNIYAAAYNIAHATFNRATLDVLEQDPNPSDMIFNNDGTKLYMLGMFGDDINEYTLSTPYDISTASFTRIALSVAAQEDNPFSMIFNNDGTRLYLTGTTGRDINEYTLSTPYDIFTATFTRIALSVSAQETSPRDLFFNNNGSKLYVMGDTGDDINEYTLSTPYDIFTATFTRIALSVAAQETSPFDTLFNNDGTKLYVMGLAGADINEYTLSTAYDVSTATFNQIALSVAAQESVPVTMLFNNDGSALYVLGQAADTVFEYTIDIVGPTVVYFSPANGATNVGVEATFEINFNEAIATSTGNIVLYKTSDDSVVETIDITSPKVTASSTTALIINPSITLDSETEYYFMIDATAVDDVYGNSYAGITDSTTWSFTSADVTAPTVVSLSPADNAIDVDLDANLIITFNEDIVTSTGNVVIYKTADDSVVETIDISGALVSASGTTALTINPTANFDYETGYYVTVANTAIDDTSGNSFAGITASTTWSFTTLNTPTCPTIAHAATYNSYPTCGVAICNTGYTLTGGACVANSGGGAFVSPSVPKVVIPPSFFENSINSSVTNVYQMAISNSEDFSGTSWELYNETYKTTQKTLYIKFRSKDGGVSKVYVVNPRSVINDAVDEINSSCIFSRDLEYGSEGEDVKELQKYLNNNGSKLSDNGAGSPGNETIYFVNRTRSALVKFQTLNNLLANGKLDTATKIFIGCVDEQKKPTVIQPNEISISINIFNRNLKIGMTGEDVKELQKYLNNRGFVLSPVGQPGSPDNETTMFGTATQNALIKFQKANNISPAVGYFGPMTRNVVNSK